MTGYIIRRMLLALLVVWLVTVGTFSMVRLLPGDVIDMLYQDAFARQKTKEMVRHQLGLDKPIYGQYFVWMGNIFKGDFGRSIFTGRPVITRLKERVPVSVELGALALIIALPLGLGVGILSAIRQGSPPDFIGRSVAIGGLSFPDFFLGTLVVLYSSVWFGYSTPLEYKPPWVSFSTNLQQMVIPAFILGFRQSASTMRITRSAMLEVMRQDYIRTAWAKGLREKAVVTRHAIRNAFIPVITVIGGQLGILIGGTVIMETLFNLPGMGRLAVDSVTQRDYPQIQAVVLLLASVIVFVNLAVDITYALLDPRIRYQ